MALDRRSKLPRLRQAALAVTCAVSLAACGEEEDPGTIPPEPAAVLLAQLDEIEASVDAGECDTAQLQALTFAASVNELPADVDAKVREELVRAAGNLEGQTGTQCEPVDTSTSGETDVIDPPATETPTEPPAGEEPQEEPPADEEPQDEPPSDDNSGQGNGGGGNSGGGSSSGGVGNG